MERADYLRAQTPHLVAEVRMYTTAEGGRMGPTFPGWGCPCLLSTAGPLTGYDAWPLLNDDSLSPGEVRRLGFYFLSPDQAVPLMRKAGRFYLWEGGVIGEATVIE